jgi:hypothetical protein
MLFWDTGTGGHNLTSEGGAGVVEDEGCKAMLVLLLFHCSFPPFSLSYSNSRVSKRP